MFGNQQGANTNDSIKAIAKEITPKLTAHWDAINLNDKLVERIKTVYNNKEKENLTPEQLTVLDKYYQGFVRGGADVYKRQIKYRELIFSLILLDNIIVPDLIKAKIFSRQIQVILRCV